MQRKQRIEFSVETKVPKEMNRKHRNYHMPFSPSFIVFTFEQVCPLCLKSEKFYLTPVCTSLPVNLTQPTR
ncbi:hypothetical protein FF1_017458 [Malus domestica]